jgi:small redox-active disulfide protein 2
MTDTVSIKILGSGCPNCRKLEALAKEVVGELGADATVEHVHDLKQIAAYGVMATPGLVVDEVVKSAGRIPSKAEVTSWVTTALSAKQGVGSTKVQQSLRA